MVINFEDIPIYSICFLLSLVTTCIFTGWFGKIQKLDKNTILCFLTYELIGILLGAKILNMIQNNNYSSIYYAGFSSYGGVIGGIIFILFFSKLYKCSLKKLFLIFIPILPLMYAVSKLGCFFNGCCYGVEYNGFMCVSYAYAVGAPINTNLFPVQLLESLVNFAIFLYILCIYKRNKENISLLGKVFILCGFCKLVLENYRASWNGTFSSTQIISLLFIIIGFSIILIRRKDEE